MTARKFRRKPVEVEAVQYTGDKPIYVPYCRVWASKTDWIVTYASGFKDVESDADFRAQYEPCEP